MKKKKYSLYQEIRSRYQLKRSSSHWKSRKREALKQRKSIKSAEIPPIWVTAPKNLSIVDNTEETMEYLAKCGELLSKGRNIGCNLSDVFNLTPDAILFLMALMNNEKYRCGKIIQGNIPKDDRAQKILLESGFMNYVKSSVKTRTNTEDYFIYNSFISKDENCPSAISRTAEDASTFLSANLELQESIYNTMHEIMTNTISHASEIPNERMEWWLYSYKDRSNESIILTMLDLGVGIFGSRGWREKVDLFKLEITSRCIAEKIVRGELTSLANKDRNIRGKGLPLIFEQSKLTNFVRANLISNDIRIDLKDDSIVSLPVSFQGTFYFFEIKNSHA